MDMFLTQTHHFASPFAFINLPEPCGVLLSWMDAFLWTCQKNPTGSYRIRNLWSPLFYCLFPSVKLQLFFFSQNCEARTHNCKKISELWAVFFTPLRIHPSREFDWQVFFTFLFYQKYFFLKKLHKLNVETLFQLSYQK